MIAYKGFETDLTCRGFQYMDGHTYISEEVPMKCRQGFHASIMPLHVLKHYSTGTYRRVEIPNNCLDIYDTLLKDDSKICGSKISIHRVPIYDLHVEQRKVMEYIVHTCAHVFGDSSSSRVPNWVDRLHQFTIDYIRALNNYDRSDELLYCSSEFRTTLYPTQVTAKDLMSIVDCFWSVLVYHFETGLNHKDFYDYIDKITFGKIEDEYYKSTIKFNEDQNSNSAT